MIKNLIFFIVEHGFLEYQARILVQSIINHIDRETVELLAVKPRKGKQISSGLLKFFRENNVSFWDVDLNRAWPFYPLANKVVTCAHVEQQTGHEFDHLVFLDTDILVTDSFHQLFEENQYRIAAKPDDDLHQIRWIDGDDPDLFWKLICDGCRLDYVSIWTVTNQITSEPFKAFFNSGVIIKKAENDFFNFWLTCFKRIMADKRLFKIDYRHFFFLEQAAFSLAAVKYFKKEEVLLLDYHHNYPVHLHNCIDIKEPPILIHYHDEFYVDKWRELYYDIFHMDKDISTLVPLNRHPEGWVNKIKHIFQFQLYKLKYKYNISL